jgi:hypothetical protein
MRVSTTVLGVVGALAGSAAAVAGYQHTAAIDAVAPPPTNAAVAAVGRPLPAAPPRVRVRLAPCHRPARLVRGACVTTVTRTQVVIDPAPAPAPALPAAVPAAPAVRPAAPVQPRRTGRPHREHDDSAEHGGHPGHGSDD